MKIVTYWFIASLVSLILRSVKGRPENVSASFILDIDPYSKKDIPHTMNWDPYTRDTDLEVIRDALIIAFMKDGLSKVSTLYTPV